MVVKQGSEFVVKSEGGKVLGTYRSRKAAERRLRQIEYFKNAKK